MEYKKINENAIKAWFITRLIVLFIVSAIYGSIAYLLLMPLFSDMLVVKYVINIFSGVLLLYLLINAAILPVVEYKQWKYLINEEKIELNYGIFIKKRVIIPISRIQFLDIKQGPIYKQFGLTCLTVNTAGSVHEIPALTFDEADKTSEYLRAMIETGDDIGK